MEVYKYDYTNKTLFSFLISPKTFKVLLTSTTVIIRFELLPFVKYYYGDNLGQINAKQVLHIMNLHVYLQLYRFSLPA